MRDLIDLERVASRLRTVAASDPTPCEPADLVVRALREADRRARRAARRVWCGSGVFVAAALFTAALWRPAAKPAAAAHVIAALQPLSEQETAEQTPAHPAPLRDSVLVAQQTTGRRRLVDAEQTLTARHRARRRRSIRRSATPMRVAAARNPVLTTHKSPFWKTEVVERDDYTAVAPALITTRGADDSGTVTPALVQVAYSTTQPVSAGADGPARQ